MQNIRDKNEKDKNEKDNNEKESSIFGTTDEKGYWSPPYPCSISPLFVYPPHPLKILKYIFGYPGYLWPRLIMYVIASTIIFLFMKSALDTPATLSLGLLVNLYIKNLFLIFVVYGGYHFLLYIKKVEGKTHKYHPNWQSTHDKKFMFKNQVYDNVFRTCIPGALVWSLYEFIYVFAYSNKLIPAIEVSKNPLYFVVLILLIPIIKSLHFFIVHRILHLKPLMKTIHFIHHKNMNPGPWSGLAMHPVEHLVYFSSLLIHLFIPSHPIHFLLHSLLLGISPAAAHIGFEGPIFNGLYQTGNYYHYLHHRYVSCNFGLASVPLDKWFGSFYDGQGKYSRKVEKKVEKKVVD